MIHRSEKIVLAGTLLLVMATAVVPGAARPKEPAGKEWPHFYPDDPLLVDRDDSAAPEAAYRETSQYYDFIENTFFKVGRGDKRGAMNINTLGGVPNSSWFTNRHGLRRLTLKEMIKGPKTGDGPDTANPWIITKAKTEGVTPGFTVKDSRGDTYFIKIDPAKYPEMSTSAEAICTPLFHAMGYNVPENYLVDVRVGDLTVGSETTIRFADGHRRKMTDEDLRDVLRKAPVRPDGTLRVIASKGIPGKGLFDHFRYYGTRPDDANDVIPHQHRRELRGLKVFAAWLNHDDTRSINTLDVYTGNGYVKHYLIDFGSCLGSGSVKPQTFRAGNEYMWEAGPTFKTLASLGLWVRPYLKFSYPDYPCVGRFESRAFRPELWRPEYPNPAFDLMDENDAFWAVKILMCFSDEEIRAVVMNGGLGDPEACEYMVETLLKRRDKTGEYYLNEVNPIDGFALEGDRLRFVNLSVKYGFEVEPEGYEITWRGYDNNTREPLAEIGSEKVSAQAFSGAGPGSVEVSLPEDAAGHYIVAEIAPTGDAPAKWQTPVRVFLRGLGGGWEIVGIYR